jgi:hypothetical protein
MLLTKPTPTVKRKNAGIFVLIRSEDVEPANESNCLVDNGLRSEFATGA